MHDMLAPGRGKINDGDYRDSLTLVFLGPINPMLWALSGAGVAELGDAGDSKSPGFCARVGSNPTSGTRFTGDASEREVGFNFSPYPCHDELPECVGKIQDRGESLGVGL